MRPSGVIPGIIAYYTYGTDFEMKLERIVAKMEEIKTTQEGDHHVPNFYPFRKSNHRRPSAEGSPEKLLAKRYRPGLCDADVIQPKVEKQPVFLGSDFAGGVCDCDR